MNLRKLTKIDIKKNRLVEAIKECNLMLGIHVSQPEYMYFLELEKHGPGDSYKRTWFYLDNICQKEHDHIPEVDERFVKRVKKTRNHNLCRRMYLRQGICIEHENLEQEG